MMDEAKPISKEKAKYLRRMEQQAKKSKEQTARTQNRRAAQKAQREEIARRHQEIDRTGPSPVFAGIREGLISPGKPKLNLNQQVALMAGQMAAQQEAEHKPVLTTEPPHQHTAECNHNMFDGAGESVQLDVTNEFTPDTVREAMEKSQT